ncbi:MAG: cupin domain-containing protein [Ignavibacteriaceae bacterium]
MFYKKVFKQCNIQNSGLWHKNFACEFRLAKGSVIPIHIHLHEQTGYMISGEMTFTINREIYNAVPGVGRCIPSKVEHGVEVLEDSIVIEVFSPV